MPRRSSGDKGKGSNSERKGSDNWGDKILEELFTQRGVDVDIGKDTNLAKLLETSRGKLHNIKLDSNNEIKTYCPPEELLEHINNISVIRQIIAWFLSDQDFNKWFDEEFSWEFRKNLPSTKKLPLNLIKPWGKEAENRPKKVDLLSPTEVAREGRQKILFYPNRSVEEKFLFEGTYYELKRQLLDYMRSPKHQENSFERFYAKRESVTKHPLLILYFSGEWTSKNYLKTLPTATHKIRLVDFVCHPADKNSGKVIDESDAREISNAIIQNFAAEGKPFSFEKGYSSFTYNSPDIGDKIIINAISESEGMRVISLMLKCIKKKFDDRNFFESKVKNTDRYKESEPVKVMGQEFRSTATTKITGKVLFRHATLKLDMLGYERQLCRVARNIVFGYDNVGK